MPLSIQITFCALFLFLTPPPPSPQAIIHAFCSFLFHFADVRVGQLRPERWVWLLFSQSFQNNVMPNEAL